MLTKDKFFDESWHNIPTKKPTKKAKQTPPKDSNEVGTIEDKEIHLALQEWWRAVMVTDKEWNDFLAPRTPIGLTDVNGIDISEGDRIRDFDCSGSEGRSGIVIWDNLYLRWAIKLDSPKSRIDEVGFKRGNRYEIVV